MASWGRSNYGRCNRPYDRERGPDRNRGFYSGRYPRDGVPSNNIAGGTMKSAATHLSSSGTNDRFGRMKGWAHGNRSHNWDSHPFSSRTFGSPTSDHRHVRLTHSSSRPQDYRGASCSEWYGRGFRANPDWNQSTERPQGRYHRQSSAYEQARHEDFSQQATSSLAALLSPFRDISSSSPPQDLLGSASVPTWSTNGVSPSISDSQRQIKVASYAWTGAHSAALDHLLATVRAAQSNKAATIQEDTAPVSAAHAIEMEREEGDVMRGAAAPVGNTNGVASGNAWKSHDPVIWTRSTRAKRILLANLIRLCGIAVVARRSGCNSAVGLERSVDERSAGTPSASIAVTSTTSGVSRWTQPQTDQCLDMIYDFCEALDQQTRLLGFAALSAISISDPSLVRRNADVLCQLLLVSIETERMAVYASLRKLLRLDLVASLQTILGAAAREGSEQRSAAIAFLAKEVVGDERDEADAHTPFGFGLNAGEDEEQHVRKQPPLKELIARDIEAQICVAELCADVLCSIQPSRELAAEQEGAGMDETLDSTKDHLKRSSFSAQIDEIHNLQIFVLGTDTDVQTKEQNENSSLLRLLFKPWDSFTDHKTHARARRAAVSLFDALAIKGLQKMHDVLELQLSARQSRTDPLAQTTLEQDRGLTEPDEVAFIGAAAEEARSLLQEQLKIRAKQAERQRKSLSLKPAAAAEDEELRFSEEEMGRIPPTAIFCAQQIARLFTWLCCKERMWDGTAEPYRRATRSVHETHDVLRSFLLGYELSPTKVVGALAPCSSVVQLFSSTVQVTLLRIAGVIALARRKDAVQHNQPSAHDEPMSLSLTSALFFATRPPQIDKAIEGKRIEALEALLWGLSLSLPLNSVSTVSIVDHAAVHELIAAWSVSAQGLASSLQHASASVEDRSYLSTLLDNIILHCEQFLQDPLARRAVEERPTWLPNPIRVLPSNTWDACVKDRLPVESDSGAEQPWWNLDLQSGDDKETDDAARIKISIRGLAKIRSSVQLSQADVAGRKSHKRNRKRQRHGAEGDGEADYADRTKIKDHGVSGNRTCGQCGAAAQENDSTQRRIDKQNRKRGPCEDDVAPENGAACKRITIRGIASERGGTTADSEKAAQDSYKRLCPTIKIVAGTPKEMLAIRGAAQSVAHPFDAPIGAFAPNAVSAASEIILPAGLPSQR